MKETRYEKILPPDVIADIIAVGESASDAAFKLGDIANEMIVLNKLSGNDITQQLVCQAVGAFCGKAGRTIRYYASVAEKFPVNVRKAYELLKFSHFAFSMKYSNWEDILEFAMLNMDDRGRPSSVDHLIAVFGYPEKEAANNESLLDMVNNLRKEIYKIPMSGDVRRLVTDALQRLVEEVQMVKEESK